MNTRLEREFHNLLNSANQLKIELAPEQEEQQSLISASPQMKTLNQNKVADLLDILLLSRLWAKPMGGYELRKELLKEFGVKVSFGTLYPHLKNLEKSECIFEQPADPIRSRKKAYRLTKLGENSLKYNALAIMKIANTLRPILEHGQESPPINSE
jgi:DNA-binding PadR family transcriptional regulator